MEIENVNIRDRISIALQTISEHHGQQDFIVQRRQRRHTTMILMNNDLDECRRAGNNTGEVADIEIGMGDQILTLYLLSSL